MDRFEHKKGKIYYSMGEVSEMFDVNPSLIRFWESKFDILKPHKNKKGNRMFTPQDVDNLKLIYHLVKEKGMTLAGAQKRLKENPEGITRDMEIVDRLMRIKAILLEIRQELKADDGEVYRDDDGAFDDEPAPVFNGEVYSDGDGAFDDEPAPVFNGQSEGYAATGGTPTPTQADMLIDLQGEEEWAAKQLEELDRLDEDIESLSADAGITQSEADQLLEEPCPIPLSRQEQPTQVSIPQGADLEITEEELSALDDEPIPDYPEVVMPYTPTLTASEPTLFGDPAPSPATQEESPNTPRIIEQTLF